MTQETQNTCEYLKTEQITPKKCFKNQKHCQAKTRIPEQFALSFSGKNLAELDLEAST
jgi:hypothetical protein